MILSLIFYTLSVSGHCLLVVTTDQCLESCLAALRNGVRKSPSASLLAGDRTSLCTALFFFKSLLLLTSYYSCAWIFPVCTPVSGALVGQKVLELLGLDSVVSHRVDFLDHTWSSGRIAQCAQPLSLLFQSCLFPLKNLLFCLCCGPQALACFIVFYL